MKAKFVFESIQNDKSVEALKNIIDKIAKTKNSRAKLHSYIDSIYNFNEDEPNLTKKDLTKIGNDFDGMILRPLYGMREAGEEYRKDLEKIAKEAGYRNMWEATQEKDNKIFQKIQFLSVYSLEGATRHYKAIKDLQAAYDTPKVKKLIKKWYSDLEELAMFAQKFEKVRQILNPTQEEKKARELKRIKGRVNPEIKKAIDEIAENFRKAIEENEFRHYTRTAEQFEVKYKEGMPVETAHDRKNPDKWMCEVLSRYLTSKNDNNIWKAPRMYRLVPDYVDKIRKDAKETSERVIASWQGKMYNKLGGFMQELNQPFTTSVMGKRERQNDILFKFKDGSQFSIRNQVVGKISPLHHFFYAYPTTFHDAFLPDGIKIKNPNEFTVKKAFNEYKNK